MAEVCDIEFCGHEHLSVPFDISSLVCESRYPFPQFLKNLELHFSGFPALAYSSYSKNFVVDFLNVSLFQLYLDITLQFQ